jgi:diguanylate cyclase (GGDEF)-like protein/PAS domain S-box-containing protein
MRSLEQEIDELRQRARQLLDKGPGQSGNPAFAVGMQDGMHDAMRLLEELRIYQTELEIQNQDLRAAQNVAEEALRKYKWLFENMPLHGLIVDRQGFVVEGNALAREQFGLREQTALQRRSVYQLFSLESRAGLHAALAGNSVPGDAIQCHFEFRDSTQPQYSEAHVLSLPDVDASPGYRLVLLVDRTAEQSLHVKQRALLQTQDSLITERNRLNNVLEGTRAATWEWEVHSREIEVNARWKEMLGYGPNDFLHLTLDTKWELTHPEDARKAHSKLTSHLAGRLEFYECELRMRHKSGAWIWTIDRARIVQRDEGGRPLRVAGTQLEVTESTELRLKMEASLSLLANLTRQLPGVLYQFRQFPDGKSCFPYASDGLRQIYGVSPADVREDATRVFSVLHPDDLQMVSDSIEKSAQTLKPWVCEYRVCLPTEGIRWVSGSARPERLIDGSILWHGFISDITDHRLAEEKFLQFNRDFETFLDQTTDFVYFKDRQSRFRFCSQALANICGFPDWRDMRGCHDLEVFTAANAHIYQAEEVQVLEQGIPLLNKIDPYTDVEGHCGFVQTNKWPILDAAGTVVGIFGISRDVSDAVRAESQLRLAASVFTHAREAIMITDLDGTILDINDSFNRITGFTRDDALGNNPRMLRSGRQSEELYESMSSTVSTEGHWSGEMWNRRKSGEIYPVMMTVCAVRDGQDLVKNYVSLFADITLLKNHQIELEQIAHFDLLTGLPNRALFSDRLEQALLQSQRRNRALSVVFMDLDGFKSVNDAYGHSAGDELLVTIAQRMKSALREGDSLARIGGDEFVAVLVDLDQQDDCLPVLDRLLQAASAPVAVHTEQGRVTTQVSASIGMTAYPRDGVDAEMLMRHADQAMYMAKQSGKNRYHLFDVEKDVVVKSQREQIAQLQSALDDGMLELYYQPKVNIQTGAVVGLEALIRWNHPERGVLSPAMFLPLVEHHSVGVNIGEWVIESALKQMRQWQQGKQNIPVSVNVGPMQLQQKEFAEKLREALARYPELPPFSLELEILESSAIQEVQSVANILQACRVHGVLFALDDFGTGFSSLNYLKHLPVDTVKVDQGFVRDMLSDPDDLAIVAGVIGLATAFGRSIVAEGVETNQHAKRLSEMGCDVVQGYGIARPMRAQAVVEWVGNWRGLT